MPESILETANLTKEFGALVANDSISISVEEGTVHGIIGPNGSGKSTLFNVISGVYEQTEGTVVFDGQDVTDWPTHRLSREGLVRTFQLSRPFDDLTVRDNLLAVYDPGLRISAEKRERAEEILDLLDIDHLADQPADGLSGGQERLLDLARVLMLEPECMMLDEPMAGINPALQDRILEYLRELNERGTTILIIEHEMGIIKEIAERVTVLNNGRVIAEGTFDEIRNDADVQRAYLSGDEEEMIADVVAQADRNRSRNRNERPEVVAEEIVSGYGNNQILHGVSVESHPDVTCIFGPNGSGKSTLLKTIAGTLPVWEGNVRFGDKDITAQKAHDVVQEGIVMLPQDGGIFPSMTLRDNLLLGSHTVEDELVDERLDEVFETFPVLEEKLDDPANSLSGGQQMMLGVGIAMMNDADVYLFDEPTAGLAPSLVGEVLDIVRTLIEKDVTIFLIEQNVTAGLKVADYVYIMAQGEIRFEGTPEQLTEEEDVIDLYLGID